MNEDKLKALLQQDQSLRDAIRQDEAERPQMPTDLNARVMQRMSVLSGFATESDGKTARNKRRRLWPWLAAACVAGVLVVLLMPPKETLGEKEIVAKVEKIAVEEPKTEKTSQRENPSPQATDKEFAGDGPRVRKLRTFSKPKEEPAEDPQKCIANESSVQPEVEFAQIAPEPKPKMLTERDIPITRPENYQYTPEEIALLKKQADEAYLKWVELELEIAKYNQEQTAQN